MRGWALCSSGRARTGIAALALGALGVVFGDIGTSPLYAFQSVFFVDGGVVHATPVHVYGAVSLVFWTITLIVSVKYVTFVMRADNDGEGGIMALVALVQRTLGPTHRATAKLVALGGLGAALFYGDSAITPALSVLSANEGLKVVDPGLAPVVVPLTVGVLTALFAVERWGTERISHLFGPVMLVWFAAIALAGLRQVAKRPAILKGLSPTFATSFVAHQPFIALVAMGAVVLCVTGAEALYSDMGHFGRAPIRLAWFALVFPALTLNYLGQAGLIVAHPQAKSNPFYLLFPVWSRVPIVVLAGAATVIASQAVISGAYSLTSQAIRLGFLPRVTIRHTSSEEAGQIYIPLVNWALFAAVVAITLAFRTSTRLSGAYGVAVTGTFITTTILFLAVARARWHWAPWKFGLFGIVFLGIESTFFLANLPKVPHGGWVTLLIAALLFTLMSTWQRGSRIVAQKRSLKEGSLEDLLEELHSTQAHVVRVPGTAIYPDGSGDTVPLALRASVDRLGVLEESVVIVSAEPANSPHVDPAEQIRIDDRSSRPDGIALVTARFGFQDSQDVPAALQRAIDNGLEGDLDLDHASYLLSRTRIAVTNDPGMPVWRKRLFVLMARTEIDPAEDMSLPGERTVVIASEVTL
ncbi:MAG: potassium transporter Kup [Solirubrobacteraceae bacterium]